MSRIRWTQQDWRIVLQAAQVLIWQHPDLTRAELVADAMTHLSAEKHRSMGNSNIHSIYSKLVEMGLKSSSEETAQAIAAPAQPKVTAPASDIPPESIFAHMVETAQEQVQDSLKGLLVANLADHKLAILESEKRMMEAMDRMNIALQEMWLGSASLAKSLFSEDLKRLNTAADSLHAVRNAALVKHVPPAAYLPQRRKPRVMIFGALPSQVSSMQDKLPDLEILGTKEIHRVKSGYNLVVIMRFCKDDDRHELQKSFPGNSIVVNGGITAVVTAIKNHMMMA